MESQEFSDGAEQEPKTPEGRHAGTQKVVEYFRQQFRGIAVTVVPSTDDRLPDLVYTGHQSRNDRYHIEVEVYPDRVTVPILKYAGRVNLDALNALLEKRKTDEEQ